MKFGPFKFVAKDKESEENSFEYVRSEILSNLSPGWEYALSFYANNTTKYAVFNVEATLEWNGEGEKTQQCAEKEVKRILDIYVKGVFNRFIDSMSSGRVQLKSNLVN